MKPGIYENKPAKEYHSGPGISKHGLDLVAQSAAHYKTSLDAGPIEPTPAMRFGTLVHTAVFEPGRFGDSYLLAPDCDKRSAANKAIWAEVEAKAEMEDRIIAKADDLKTIKRIVEAIKSHRTAAQACFAKGKREPSIYANDPETGVLCRCRPDLLTDGDTIVDLKTANLADMKEFSKSIANFRYHVQAAFYLDMAKWSGLKHDKFVFVAVEKEEPFAVATYVLDEASIEKGREEYRANLNFYADCLKHGEWPAYSQNLETISLPSWAMRAA